MQPRIALAALFLVVTASRPSEACKTPHATPFQMFDEAAHVAIGTVASLPPPRPGGRAGAGDATLAVARTLKGPAGKELTIRISDTSCGVELRPAERLLVFTTADGLPAGAYQGVVRDVGRWEKALASWSAAGTDAAARAAVLVDAIASGDDKLAVEAAAHLVDEPALIAAIDPAGRKRLGAATVGTSDWSFGWLLVRLHDPRAARVVPPWAGLAKGIAAVTAFEAVSDTAALAGAIERGPAASRFAAFDRCERVRGLRLARFSRYVQDLDTPKTPAAWSVLATACRRGTPVR
ncbi:MAG: hypothetical protein KIT31_08470 [Deltaproteobacteria bacterium]|nr:hypothetical protein [Deltaproteobacteria bacterium]